MRKDEGAEGQSHFRHFINEQSVLAARRSSPADGDGGGFAARSTPLPGCSLPPGRRQRAALRRMVPRGLRLPSHCSGTTGSRGRASTTTPSASITVPASGGPQAPGDGLARHRVPVVAGRPVLRAAGRIPRRAATRSKSSLRPAPLARKSPAARLAETTSPNRCSSTRPNATASRRAWSLHLMGGWWCAR